MKWIAQRIWPDSTVYILGGGPSLNAVPLDLIKGEHVIGINNAYQLGDWVDVCWFGDSRWWFDFGHGKRLLKEFFGLRVCCVPRLDDHPGIKTLTRGKPLGIETRPQFVAWNRNSGGSAINLAYHLGGRRIVLVGFDMQRVNDRANWHEDHPCPQKDPYERYRPTFSIIAKEAKALGVEILNTAPESAITVFPTVKLEDTV